MIPSNLFVCALGMGVVFIALFFMVLVCHLTHLICDKITYFLAQRQSQVSSNTSKTK